jgi:hypothetical protein
VNYNICASFRFPVSNRVWWEAKGNRVSDRMETEWLSGEDRPGVYEMAFMKPKTAKYFVVVQGIKAGKDNKAVESFTARGYKIWGWGKC